MFHVVLETPEGPRAFECGVDDYVWDAAARHGIRLPSICRQGRCLTCAGRLISGTVDQKDADAYFAQDRSEGFVLVCRAKPRSDLRVLTHREWQMRQQRIAHGLPAPYA